MLKFELLALSNMSFGLVGLNCGYNPCILLNINDNCDYKILVESVEFAVGFDCWKSCLSAPAYLTSWCRAVGDMAFGACVCCENPQSCIFYFNWDCLFLSVWII